jgi:dsDNA-specific endonuclease/ATPase MutS2
VLQRLQARRAGEIQARWGFDFGVRDFLLVPREILGRPEDASDLLRVEPFDESKYAVRMQDSAEAFLFLERRLALLARERAAEDAVLDLLSQALRDELPRFTRYRETITRFDLAFARARLAREHRLVRPVIGNGTIDITQGRYLPCEEICRKLGTDYVALDARFDRCATVIFGSNMGGKTVVLKTLAFLQLCAQMGLFVPAEAFTTGLFQHFHYLGEGHVTQAAQGLSGFGFEIRQFVEASRHFNEPTLVLFDEFARTTNSLEAEAILSAVLDFVVAQPGVVSLFSTHFRGVRRLPGVSYLRMKGLNREGLDLGLASGERLEARIRLIDQRMDYHLIVDDGGPGALDAIAVAGLLGLDPAITTRAASFFGHEPRAIQE